MYTTIIRRCFGCLLIVYTYNTMNKVVAGNVYAAYIQMYILYK